MRGYDDTSFDREAHVAVLRGQVEADAYRPPADAIADAALHGPEEALPLRRRFYAQRQELQAARKENAHLRQTVGEYMLLAGILGGGCVMFGLICFAMMCYIQHGG